MKKNYFTVIIVFICFMPFEVISQTISPKEKDGKWGYVNQSDKEVIPFKYDNAQDFENGMARVRLDEKVGFIDTLGVEIIPLIFNSIMPFADDGTAWAELKGKWEVIDKTGKVTNKNNLGLGLPVRVGVDNCQFTIKDFYIGKDSIGNTMLNVLYDRQGSCTYLSFNQLQPILLRAQIVANKQGYYAKDRYLSTILSFKLVDKQLILQGACNYFFETDATPDAAVFFTNANPDAKVTVNFKKKK